MAKRRSASKRSISGTDRKPHGEAFATHHQSATDEYWECLKFCVSWPLPIVSLSGRLADDQIHPTLGKKRPNGQGAVRSFLCSLEETGHRAFEISDDGGNTS